MKKTKSVFSSREEMIKMKNELVSTFINNGGKVRKVPIGTKLYHEMISNNQPRKSEPD